MRGKGNRGAPAAWRPRGIVPGALVGEHANTRHFPRRGGENDPSQVYHISRPQAGAIIRSQSHAARLATFETIDSPCRPPPRSARSRRTASIRRGRDNACLPAASQARSLRSKTPGKLRLRSAGGSFAREEGNECPRGREAASAAAAGSAAILRPSNAGVPITEAAHRDSASSDLFWDDDFSGWTVAIVGAVSRRRPRLESTDAGSCNPGASY